MEKLPLEIQQVLLSFSGYNKEDIKECILVCSSWRRTYERLLYSRVKLFNFHQLTLFVENLNNKQHLRSAVTDIKLQFVSDYEDHEKRSIIAQLFTFVVNLERFEGRGGTYFKPLLDAISANQLSRLNYLISPEEDEDIDDYTACALLLKDRLKNLDIVELGGDEDERIDYRPLQLIYKLNQFKKLETLCIDRETDDVISLLEDLTTQCPSLRELTLDVYPYEHRKVIKFEVTNTIISNFLPAPSISRLCLIREIDDPQIISYILDKFPNLENLEINMPYMISDIPFNVNTTTVIQFLDHLPKIRHILVNNIPWRDQELVDATGSLWKILSQSRPLHVMFKFNDALYPMNTMDVFTKVDAYHCAINYFPSSVADERYYETMRKYGCYIDRLQIVHGGSFGTDTQLQHSLNELFIHKPLSYCINVKELTMYCSNITVSSLRICESIEKKVFNVLCLRRCILENSDVFQKFFCLIAYAKFIEIDGIIYKHCTFDSYAPFRRIYMPETEIGTLLLSNNPFFEPGKDTIWVSLLIQEVQAFYIYDFRSMHDKVFKSTTKELLLKKFKPNKAFLVSIRCKSLETLIVKYRDTEIKLHFSDS
ncbi:unnamed protein product [Mucor hiemalis]